MYLIVQSIISVSCLKVFCDFLINIIFKDVEGKSLICLKGLKYFTVVKFALFNNTLENQAILKKNTFT